MREPRPGGPSGPDDSQQPRPGNVQQPEAEAGREPRPARRSGDARRPPGDLTHLGSQVQELLAQVGQAVRALNRLAAALEETLARPPVHLQVERLEVQTLAFHLGDIDVEELQGELNIGITHSLRVQPPGRGGAAPQTPDPPARQGGGGDSARSDRALGGPVSGGQAQDGPDSGGRVQRGPAQGQQAQGEQVQSGKAHGGSTQRTLRNSVVSRRLALMPPDATPDVTFGATPDPTPGPGCEPPRRVQVWPPPKSEGSVTDDKNAP